MSLTTKNFGNQNRTNPAAAPEVDPFGGAGADTVAGFDPVVEIQNPAPTGKAVKPADSSWDSCSTPNDYKNQQSG